MVKIYSEQSQNLKSASSDSKGNKKPFLLLDVDGVLCPFGIEDPTQPPEGYSLDDAGGFSLWYAAKANSARLRLLSNSFELVWATMWEDNANDVIAPLHNLSELPVISFHEHLARKAKEGDFNWNTHYKLGAIEEYVGDRPFAWIDDDIDESVLRWAASRRVPTLVVPVAPDQGLNEAIVQKLLDFANDLNRNGEECGNGKSLGSE